MNARRGFVPEDETNFSKEAISTLQKAARHVCYLINEGYHLKQASTFVGNHFLLSERQRLAVMRSVATTEQLSLRQKKQIPLERLSGEEVWLDGFNQIITLEVMLCHSPLFLCMDGTIRDLAALRGTYRIIPETKRAVRAMFDQLQETDLKTLHVLLDEPVSNSGRLKVLMAEMGEDYTFDLDLQILKSVDQVLSQKPLAITSDSVILDRCIRWSNLIPACMKKEAVSGIRIW